MQNDSDDSDILADIQALDEVLAATSQEKQQQRPSSSSPLRFDVYSTDNDSESDIDSSDFLKENCDVDSETLTAYEINTRLITGLTLVKKKVVAILQECERKITELDEKLTSTKERNVCTKLAISSAGMPYFKDKKYYRAPKNYDIKMKEARGELSVLFLQKPSRWSGAERETLLRAVHNEAFESVLSVGFKEIDKKPGKDAESNQAETSTLVLPRTFNEMVGPLGEREFDWLKISTLDFDGKHSAGECRAMWNVYLHPDIRKSEWTAAEDMKLLKCAKQCQYQDWDKITQELGTNRSSYQCFIRYNTIKKIPSCGRPWTKHEDKHLLKVISALRIGEYIPWSEVANYLRHRTKQQIYTRWMYRKAPHLKKGRFTFLETQELVKAVEKYGKDFSKIRSTVMTHRTCTQLSDHYHMVIASKNGQNVWTLDTDIKLIQLHKEYGNNWSKIATHFTNKSRTQVRHRFNAIVKYIRRGITVDNIPRPPSFDNRRALISKRKRSVRERNKRALLEELMRKVNHTHRNIDINDIQPRLYETFSFPPTMETTAHQEEPYDFMQLARDTKKLYDTLYLLDAKLEIPTDVFLDYIQLNRRDKELLASLKEYINTRENGTLNSERLKEFRTQMFGSVPKVSEKSRFIPPLPFNGYVKTRKVKMPDRFIDCNVNLQENFVIDMPLGFSVNALIHTFVSVEEEIQFDKLGQFLINSYRNCDKRNVDKSLKNSSSFDEGGASSSSGYNKLNSKVSPENCKRANQSNKLSTRCIDENDEDDEDPRSAWRNMIQPNQATLLGLKNLLLWKLLYEYENESDSDLLENEKPEETKSTEYQLLRTRLLKLFKFPIGLSNTILQTCELDKIFIINEEQNFSRKRKVEDINPMQPIKKR